MKLIKKQRITGRQRQTTRLIVAAGCMALIVGFSTFFISNLGSSQESLAAPGKNGSKSITSGTVILNEYTTLTSDVSAGNTGLTVAASSLNSNSRFPANLASGDLILIIQMQGATITTTNNSSYGSVSSYNNAGKYEFANVSAVPNSTSITVANGLKNAYTASGKVQIVRVQRYTTLSLSSGATITAPAWDGSKGGIVALEITGTSVINGTIDVSYLGFRGGQVEQNTNTAITSYRSTNSTDGAEKGEGIAGSQSDYATIGKYGRGAPANGGGGGNAHNGGGGGGANAGAIASWNGGGIPDNSVGTYTTAWNLEGGSFSANNSTGGGRGGYAWSNASKNPTTLAPGSSTWDGDSHSNVGGLGGRPLTYSSSLVFMGGGGGAGDSNNGNGTAGGEGGGIVFICSGGNITGTGTIKANGESVSTGSDAGNSDASGGGGGGGAVIVYQKNATATGISIQARGGNGGNHAVLTANFPECEGPGGGGGGGYVAMSANIGATISVSGGNNGTTNSSVFSTFLPNGATRGASGISNGTAPTNPYSTTNTLPVELVSFTVHEEGKQILLKWVTASEKDNDYFILERSSDGRNFEIIGRIAGNGTKSSFSEYGFIDANPVRTITYYRLSQKDFDGKTESFTPISVNPKLQSTLLNVKTIFPNPFKDETEIVLLNVEKGPVTVIVQSPSGAVVSKEEITCEAGTNVIQYVPKANIKPGTYFLSFKSGNQQTVSAKIFKQ